jgi:hypothetical protein
MSIENLKTFGEPPLPYSKNVFCGEKGGSRAVVRMIFSVLRMSRAPFFRVPFKPYRRSFWSATANIRRHTDPFAEADEDTGETKQSQNYIHIRIQREYTCRAFFPNIHGTARLLTPHFEISLLTSIHSQSAMVVRL